MKKWTTSLRRLILLSAIASGGAFVWQTVTGVSPLSLANAIAHSIESLTQYGKCAQASTPTPSSPVDIKCNNGALKMVDDELPSGYKRLLGLTFNNNVYYPITGFKMRGSDTLRFSFKCSMQTPACNVLGAYDGTSAQTNYSLYLGNSTSAKYLRYNGGTYRSDADSDTQYDVVITPTGATGMKADSSWTAKTFESDGDLCIGTTSPTATSSKMVGDIIGNIVVDGRLKLIPSERVSDNVLGYYDTVGEAFYEPTGSGVVSMGYDGSHYELAVVGTPEVLSVTATGKPTQTASVQTLYAVGDYADEQDIISGLVTRKCGVKVLDGTETWAGTGGTPTSVLVNCYTMVEKLGDGSMTPRLVYCTHYKGSATLPSANDREGFALLGNASSSTQGYEEGYYLGIGATTTYPNIEDFKSFLAEQYAAGTPVIVIYPLARETAEAVAAQHLKTVAGDNTVSVTSEVDPVTLSVKYATSA